MFDLSRKKAKPGTFYALAFCVNLIAFIMICVGAFTPNWTQITEYDGVNEVKYERGLVVTCNKPGVSGCKVDTDYGNRSGELLTSFVLTIFAIILAFFSLQLFVVGQCVRSCREQNLGAALTVMVILIAVFLCAALALFEASITEETTAGYSHRKDTFGFSRGIIAGAIVLYFVSAFFSLGEHFKRQKVVGSEDAYCNNQQSGVFSLNSSGQHNKRVSNSDGHSGNAETYFRTRGSYKGNPQVRDKWKKAAANVRGVDVWR